VCSATVSSLNNIRSFLCHLEYIDGGVLGKIYDIGNIQNNNNNYYYNYNYNIYCSNVGRDSVAGVATRYELDGPGIESRLGGTRFSTPTLTRPGAHPASYTMSTRSFLGVKAAGTTNPLLAPRLKEE